MEEQMWWRIGRDSLLLGIIVTYLVALYAVWLAHDRKWDRGLPVHTLRLAIAERIWMDWSTFVFFAVAFMCRFMLWAIHVWR